MPLNYVKPYPVCRWAHGALDALRKLMTGQGVTAARVARIRVRTFAQSARLFAGMPRTTSQAQYSLNFALAVLLLHGRIGPEHISGQGLEDPAVAALLPRITVQEHAPHSQRFPAGRWSDIEVTLNDGRVLASGDVNARGGPEAPMSDPELREKLHQMAGAVLPAGRIDAIWSLRDGLLDPDRKFSDLTALVTPAPEVT